MSSIRKVNLLKDDTSEVKIYKLKPGCSYSVYSPKERHFCGFTKQERVENPHRIQAKFRTIHKLIWSMVDQENPEIIQVSTKNNAVVQIMKPGKHRRMQGKNKSDYEPNAEF